MENSSATITGILYVVATPIGNLDDISLRAINTLKSVDTILAEDTRHSQQLLHALAIHKPLLALHDHNEASKSRDLIQTLKKGQSLALISDAGTPLISDPGFILVRMAREEGIRVVPIPGPCALITALCAAGIPCDNFTFSGFLPAKQTARLARLQSIALSEQTTILYESTHRILACLEDIRQVFGADYRLVLAKELTKTFEHIMQATSRETETWLLAEPGRIKGEFVLILPARPLPDTAAADRTLLSVLLAELPLKQAVKLACQLSKTAKNDLYKLALTMDS